MTLCVLLTTVGRPTLPRMLASLAAQEWAPGDGVLPASDDRHEEVARAWAASGLPGRHVPFPDGPHGYWGHSLRNRLLPTVASGYVLHADDDDVFLPGALAMVRAATAKRAFHFFPFVRRRDAALVGAGKKVAPSEVGTPNFVHPADVALAEWELWYGGDGDFICRTVARNRDLPVVWHPAPHYYAYPDPVMPLEDCWREAAGIAAQRDHQSADGT